MDPRGQNSLKRMDNQPTKQASQPPPQARDKQQTTTENNQTTDDRPKTYPHLFRVVKTRPRPHTFGHKLTGNENRFIFLTSKFRDNKPPILQSTSSNNWVKQPPLKGKYPNLSHCCKFMPRKTPIQNVSPNLSHFE